MNLTHKKTPSIPIGQLKRIIYCRLQSSLYVKKDKSCARGTYQLQHQLGGEGKAPSLGSQTGCLLCRSVEVCRKLQPGQGVTVYPAWLKEEHKQPSQGSRGSGAVVGKGACCCPATGTGPGRKIPCAAHKSNSKVKCLQEHCFPSGREALHVETLLLSRRRLIAAWDELREGPF